MAAPFASFVATLATAPFSGCTAEALPPLDTPCKIEPEAASKVEPQKAPKLAPQVGISSMFLGFYKLSTLLSIFYGPCAGLLRPKPNVA